MGAGDAELVAEAEVLEHLDGLLGDGEVGARAEDDGHVNGARAGGRGRLVRGGGSAVAG